MELLYIWINQSDNEQLLKKGFNLSPRYSFKLKIREDRYELSNDPDWQGKESIFKSDVITNVTAVVGKNGTGKTTFLNNLYHADGTPYTDHDDPKYAAMNEYERERSYCILVYQKDDSPIIIHNIKDKTIISTDGFPVYDLNHRDTWERFFNDPEGYNAVLNIYLSNSQFGIDRFRGLSSMGKRKTVSLIPDNINLLSDKFYQNLLGVGLFREGTPSIEWKSMVLKNKTLEDFQSLCDLIYFDYLHETGKETSYDSIVSNSIVIKPTSPIEIMDKSYPRLMNYDYEEQVPEELKNQYNLYQCFKKLVRRPDMYEDFVISFLYLFLITEYVFDSNFPFPYDLSDYEAINAWIESYAENLRAEDYFSNALTEIEELKTLLDLADNVQNYVPEGDGAYKHGKLFEKSNHTAYYNLLTFIKELFEKETSFVLRYLKITIPGMSSGERAFQNLFSWLNMMPYFSKIDRGIIPELPHSILLLVDEVDLYMHPEWEQHFVKNMITELENQFAGHEIQLVVATHSPLCLSDIPRENCIYLDRDENGDVTVVERQKMKQTFGCDIYTLLSEAFFMGDITMGSFAHDYIQKLIERLNDDTPITTAEMKNIQNQIAYIGNPIIAAKLRQMLDWRTKADLYLRKQYLESELEKVNHQLR